MAVCLAASNKERLYPFLYHGAHDLKVAAAPYSTAVSVVAMACTVKLACPPLVGRASKRASA